VGEEGEGWGNRGGGGRWEAGKRKWEWREKGVRVGVRVG
jgi:hypothetical protein